MSYKSLIFFLLFILGYYSCAEQNKQEKEELPIIINTVVANEMNMPFCLIQVNEHDSLYHNMSNKFLTDVRIPIGIIKDSVDKRIDSLELSRLFKKAVNDDSPITINNKRLKLVSASPSDIERNPFLCLSKPVKQFNYYFIEMSYTSMASGYIVFYVLQKVNSKIFKIVLRVVTGIV